MTDQFDERADDVRVLLETAQVPAANADLARAIAVGGVVRRRRRYAAVAAATVFALAGTAAVGQALDRTAGDHRLEVPIGETVTATPTPAPYSACTVAALPAPAGKDVLSGQMVADPTGRYAAASLVEHDGGRRPVLWTAGVPRALPPVGESAQPVAVNSSGVVVGTSSTDDGGPLAWVYRDGHAVKLAPVPGFEWWVPLSVDEDGEVTGEAWRGMRFVVVSWTRADPGGGGPVLVTKPGDVRGSGVGGDGTVVGTRGEGAAPFAWHRDGTGRALEIPPGAAAAQVLAVRGRWAAGWVGVPEGGTLPSGATVAPRARAGSEQDRRLLGMIGKTDGRLATVPARWDLRTGEVAYWPDRTMPATAVNASGWVAIPGDSGPVVVSPAGTVTALPGPVDGYPTTLSDDNRILYGERVPVTPDAAKAMKEQAPKRAGTELLVWHC